MPTPYSSFGFSVFPQDCRSAPEHQVVGPCLLKTVLSCVGFAELLCNNGGIVEPLITYCANFIVSISYAVPIYDWLAGYVRRRRLIFGARWESIYHERSGKASNVIRTYTAEDIANARKAARYVLSLSGLIRNRSNPQNFRDSSPITIITSSSRRGTLAVTEHHVLLQPQYSSRRMPTRAISQCFAS
jgi:hypothetical protein